MKNKSRLNELKSGYVKIPTKLLEIGLSPGAVCIYNYLVNDAEGFNPSVNWLALKSNMSRNSVCKYISELESRNIIRCYHQGFKGSVSKYAFNPVSEWIEKIV